MCRKEVYVFFFFWGGGGWACGFRVIEKTLSKTLLKLLKLLRQVSKTMQSKHEANKSPDERLQHPGNRTSLNETSQTQTSNYPPYLKLIKKTAGRTPSTNSLGK